MSNRFPYRQFPHQFCGSNPERQLVGDSGHCEDCVSVGHIVAHPELGCGDVGCTRDHPEPGDGSAGRPITHDQIKGIATDLYRAGLTNRLCVNVEGEIAWVLQRNGLVVQP